MKEKYGKSPILAVLKLIKQHNKVKRTVRIAAEAAFYRERMGINDR